MRWLVAITLMHLSACGSEPDFDERYANAENQVEIKASDIQKDLDADRKLANENEVVAGRATSSVK